MLKKIISFALSLIMIFSIFNLTAQAADDKPSSWAEKEVTAAIAAKLVPQPLQSKYAQPTTRAEFCALVVTLYENIKGKAITECKTFADTKDINVEKAGGIGVASALGEGKFYPGAKITREHVAIMTARLANALGKPLPKKAVIYEDKSSISASALESVGQVQAAGLMIEAGNNNFAPKETYSREQNIVTMIRTYNMVKGTEAKPPKPTDPAETQKPSSNVDPNIIGHWHYTNINYYRYYNLFINEDGTFIYYLVTTAEYSYKGNYSVSDGKIYFTNVVFTNDNYKNNEPDSWVEYVIEPDSKGNELLKISNTGGCFMGSPWWKRIE